MRVVLESATFWKTLALGRNWKHSADIKHAIITGTTISHGRSLRRFLACKVIFLKTDWVPINQSFGMCSLRYASNNVPITSTLEIIIPSSVGWRNGVMPAESHVIRYEEARGENGRLWCALRKITGIRLRTQEVSAQALTIRITY